MRRFISVCQKKALVKRFVLCYYRGGNFNDKYIIPVSTAALPVGAGKAVFVLLLRMGLCLECCRRFCKRLHGAAVADLERMLGNGRDQPFQNFR